MTTLYALLIYGAAAVFVAGLCQRLWVFMATPAPLHIPTTPAPTTRAGVVVRLLHEAVFFRSLFHSNKWIWLFGWAFHVALLVVLASHLRYFVEPVWAWLGLVHQIGSYAGMAMVAALAALWARRFLVPRIAAVSGWSDHLAIALLIGIAASGLLMKFVARTDIVAVKAFSLGLVYFDWRPLPLDFALIIHLTLVALLLIVFPFSKLLHGVALFINPTRSQPDNVRVKRYAPRVVRQAAGASGPGTA